MLKKGGVLFTAPNTSINMQQDARTLHEMGLLGRYVTPFGVSTGGFLMKTARAFDGVAEGRIARELARRAITEIPGGDIETYPWLEWLRTLLSRSSRNQRVANDFYFYCLTQLTRHVATKVKQYDAVYAYDSAALEIFQAARAQKKTCILGVGSLHPRFYADIRAEEFSRHPETFLDKSPHMAATSPDQIRRREEAWALADIVVANSAITRDSHAAFGLDTAKVHVVPLAFPDPAIAVTSPDSTGPLKLLWAGTFTAMKGAHYLLDGLRRLPPSSQYDLRIFGINDLPVSSLAGIGPCRIQPTIPRQDLLVEYRKADILVMPTLSDGFGMVIAEAMSQGLPVLTTTRAGAAGFITHGVDGFVMPPAESQTLTDILLWCIGNRSALHAMRQPALEQAKNWQWKDYRAKLKTVLAPLLLSAGLQNSPAAGA